jgi:hypothetical protein
MVSPGQGKVGKSECRLTDAVNGAEKDCNGVAGGG